MQFRRRFKQTDLLEDRLAEEAKRLQKEAKLLPPGALREEVLRKARQAETGAAAPVGGLSIRQGSVPRRSFFRRTFLSDAHGTPQARPQR
jgi:hypothetical protein